MEDKRAQTLEALDNFIQSQKAMLSRTQSDIERLKQLRAQAALTSPLESIRDELSGGLFSLHQADFCLPELPQAIDWSLFTNQDPSLLRNFATTSYAESARPFPRQTSQLSELQQFVRDTRRVMIDPVLAKLEPPDSDNENDKPCPMALPERPRGRGGLFVRKKANQEAKLLLSDKDPPNPIFPVDAAASTSTATPPPPPHSSSSYAPPERVIKKSSRSRRPTVKLRATNNNKVQNHAQTTTTPQLPQPAVNGGGEPPRKLPRVRLLLGPRPPDPEPRHSSTSSSSSSSSSESVTTFSTPEPLLPPPPLLDGKPKPETFKQPWTTEEQRLLDQLLAEIPPTAPNRYVSISKRMGGRRNAKQIASRVQKLRELLKRCGVDDSNAMVVSD